MKKALPLIAAAVCLTLIGSVCMFSYYRNGYRSRAEWIPLPNQDGYSFQLNINIASARELQTLPGVGETLANRIVSYREAYGPFTSLETLLRIEGFTQALFLSLREKLTIGGT